MMFERFTLAARRVVVVAQEDARERRQSRVRTENLLIALYDGPPSPGAELLIAAGVGRSQVDAEIGRLRHPDGRHGSPEGPDAESLAILGIDLGEVRRQAEETFGPGALDRTRAAGGEWTAGHIRFDVGAKQALQVALREAVRLRHGQIGSEHLLLGLLGVESGAAAHILRAHGVTLFTMRDAVEELGRGQASG